MRGLDVRPCPLTLASGERWDEAIPRLENLFFTVLTADPTTSPFIKDIPGPAYTVGIADSEILTIRSRNQAQIALVQRIPLLRT